MNGASQKSSQATLWDLPNATGSPVEGFGPSLCDKPGGQTTGPSGPEAAPANPIPELHQIVSWDLRTSGIYGLHGTRSLSSATLSASLANKLTTVLFGSTECTLTWKKRIMPSGRWIFRLVPSMRLWSECGLTLWPCPTVQDSKNNAGHSQWRRNSYPLNVQAVAHFMATTQRPANLASVGAMNEAFPLWLMGIPAEWELFALRAMQSVSLRRKRSSKATSKQCK